MLHSIRGTVKFNRAELLRAKGYMIGLYKVLTGDMKIDRIKNIK